MKKGAMGILPLLLTILIMGCVTAPVEKTEDVVIVKDYYNDTKALLYKATDQEFWYSVNKNEKEFPEETANLLLDYFSYQKELIEYYISQEDPASAKFHMNNLRAVPEQAEGDISIKNLEMQIDSLLLDNLNVRRSEFLSEGTPMSSNVEDLTQYNESLAVVHVKYSWENEDGIKRYNKDDMAGSGFLITPTHVLTAFHVIESVFDDDITSYKISLKFGEEEYKDVKVLAWDSLTDLAVLELPEPTDRPYLYHLLGDEDDIKQGDTVFALGHPYGYSYTFSKGIVSYTDRNAPEWGSWIQIDASVGPGSSGGLLINEKGQVSGLVVAGLSGEELNFAVPSSLIRKVIDPMLDGISFKRPWCGLMFKDDEKNAILHHIFEESPLAFSELEAGDRLIRINTQEIESVDSAKIILDGLDAGNMISLTFLRGEEESTYRIRMMRRPDYAVYNKIKRMDIFERILVSSSTELFDNNNSLEIIQLGRYTYVYKKCKVKSIDTDSFLYSRGVRVGDYLGLMDDYFENQQYYLTMIHIPKRISVNEMKDPRDMIITVTKDKYNENIL